MRREIDQKEPNDSHTTRAHGVSNIGKHKILEIAQLNRNRYKLSQEHNAISSKRLEITQLDKARRQGRYARRDEK